MGQRGNVYYTDVLMLGVPARLHETGLFCHRWGNLDTLPVVRTNGADVWKTVNRPRWGDQAVNGVNDRNRKRLPELGTFTDEGLCG